ncbi:carbonic anhydrase [Thiocystis violascens]|uniref:carbonic anhydrase n=1 Tax=Thiocystis violascens (strain ATCC 17096 / DSM 198 / 6111) TaxID=765911 RepID=I3YH20_THIV6|nr:carbonic anhydrase family protein [Thiocystis violascens]AFL76288.1 carbonic anhydrase [Thiocystis violascens DSM 198]
MVDTILLDGCIRAPRRAFVFLVTLIAAAGSGSSIAAASDASGPRWSYAGESGPAHWGDLDAANETCVKGLSQSPVDLAQTQPAAFTPLSFQYRSQRLEAVNNGHGVHVLSPPGSALLVRGDAYDLEEFNFHVPGEHGFNGVTAEAEIHLVHRDRQGGYVIVAVPVRAGERENRILSRILEYLPMRGGEQVRHRQVGINPIFLLPTDHSYFRYVGSLVTPPCTEPVLWFVMKEALEVSPWQIQRIAQAVGANARPLQPLNGRPVFSLFRQ